MRSLEFLIFAVIATVLSNCDSHRTASDVVAEYHEAISEIELASYQVHRIDTFASGAVWNRRGEAIMKRDGADTKLGFQLHAVQDSVPSEVHYDGSKLFLINKSKRSYEYFQFADMPVLYTPGGQMIVEDLMIVKDTIIPTLSQDEKNFILTYSYPDRVEDEVTRIHKKIYVDRQTYLPKRVESRRTIMGDKQVTIWAIDGLAVNSSVSQAFFDLEYLSEYAVITRPNDVNLHESLIQSEIEDYSLTTFDQQVFRISSKLGNILLLDFWEIWCGPCLSSMPNVQRLHEDYEASGLQVLGIITEANSVEKAKRILSRKGVTYPNAIGSKDLANYLKVTGIPQYVLVDREGTIVYISQGFSDSIEVKLKELL